MPTMKTDNPSLRPVAGFGRTNPIRPNQKATPDKAMDSREIQKSGLEATNETWKQTAGPEGLPLTFEIPSPRPPLLRRKEASEYLKQQHGVPVAPATLAGRASYGDGPAFHRLKAFRFTPVTSWPGGRKSSSGRCGQSIRDADPWNDVGADRVRADFRTSGFIPES